MKIITASRQEIVYNVNLGTAVWFKKENQNVPQ